MTSKIVATWTIPKLPIVAKTADGWNLLEEQFPIHRIYCVGRNYREHAAEMNVDIREPPVFFLKTDAVSTWGESSRKIQYPSMTSNLHYEGELAIAIGRDQPLLPRMSANEADGNVPGAISSTEDAMSIVFGYAIACDLTRRDLQKQSKEKGQPWDTSKSFEESCPVSAIVSLADTQISPNSKLTTHVDAECRQQTLLSDMTWSVPEIIMHLSMYFRLRAGDLILTGTPAGVGPLHIGNTVRIRVTEDEKDILPPCEFEICD